MNIFINVCIIVFAFCMLCHIRKRRTRETIRLLEIWLKNEKIVRLLEKSNIHDFLCKPEKSRFWLLDNHSYCLKLLKEHVNNDKIFNEFGVLIIHEYYTIADPKPKLKNLTYNLKIKLNSIKKAYHEKN